MSVQKTTEQVAEVTAEFLLDPAVPQVVVSVYLEAKASDLEADKDLANKLVAEKLQEAGLDVEKLLPVPQDF